VVVLDLQPPAATEALWRPADITRLEHLLEATKDINAIYHLAAVSNVNVAYKNPLGCIEANIRGTANVLEAARNNKIQRVILASTVWVYNAAPDGHANEETGLLPGRAGHLYTATKIADEMLCCSYRELYGVPFTVLRYGIPYGPGMRQELVIATFIRKALNGEPITITGDGKQYRKFIYVEDLAQGNVAALMPIAENKTYNLEGAERISILDIAETLNRIMGGVKIQFLPSRPGDFSGCETTFVKAEQELGWRPRTSFEEGLRFTFSWYVQQRKQEAGALQPATRGS
jgi:UDP-glucose 4-epimerase